MTLFISIPKLEDSFKDKITPFYSPTFTRNYKTSLHNFIDFINSSKSRKIKDNMQISFKNNMQISFKNNMQIS